MKLIVLSLVLVSGCTSAQIWQKADPAEIAKFEAAERAKKAEQIAAYVAGLRQQCLAYGFQADSPQVPECVMRLHTLQVQSRAAERQTDAIQGAALLNYSQGLMQQGQRVFPAQQGFTCQTIGNMTSCR